MGYLEGQLKTKNLSILTAINPTECAMLRSTKRIGNDLTRITKI